MTICKLNAIFKFCRTICLLKIALMTKFAECLSRDNVIISQYIYLSKDQLKYAFGIETN